MVAAVGDRKAQETRLTTIRHPAILLDLGFLRRSAGGVVTGALDDEPSVVALNVSVKRWPLPAADVKSVIPRTDSHL